MTGLDPKGLPIVERTPPPGPAIQPSTPLPLGRDAQRPDPPLVPVDTRPAWYVSRIPGGAYAWRPTPGDPGTVQVLRTQRNNRWQPVRWPSVRDALANFAEFGLWAQEHPFLAPLEPARRLGLTAPAPGFREVRP